MLSSFYQPASSTRGVLNNEPTVRPHEITTLQTSLIVSLTNLKFYKL
jgi:hypothetical protein